MSEWCALTRLNSVYFVINDPIPLVLPGRTFAGKWQLHYSVIPSGGRDGGERERSVKGVCLCGRGLTHNGRSVGPTIWEFHGESMSVSYI